MRTGEEHERTSNFALKYSTATVEECLRFKSVVIADYDPNIGCQHIANSIDLIITLLLLLLLLLRICTLHHFAPRPDEPFFK